MACLFFALSAQSLAQEEVDEGTLDEVTLFLNALNNAKGNVENSAAALVARETVVVSKTRVGLMAKDDGARELYAIGRAYWERCEYDNEFRILEMAIDLDPNSFAAARAWMLIGDTYYGNKARPDNSIEPFRKAKSLLDATIIDQEVSAITSQEAVWQAQAIVLGRLGFASVYVGNEEEAEKYYLQLVDSPGIARSADPALLLNAYRQLAEFSSARSDFDAAKKYSTASDGLIERMDLPKSMQVDLLYESIRRRHPDPHSPERIRELELLWADSRFIIAPAILRVGDELSFTYFFRDPIQRSEFKKLAIEFRRRILRMGELSGNSSAESCQLRNYLLIIDFAVQFKPEEIDVTEMRKDVESLLRNKDVVFSVAGSRTAAEADIMTARLIAIFERQFPKQAQASKERAAKTSAAGIPPVKD